jgi:hypothetical protein
MRSSHIVSIAPAKIDGGSGFVILGEIAGLAYVHFAPWQEPRTVVFPHGDLTNPQPSGDGMTATIESPRPDWADEATIVYDPTPEPFVWGEFVAAHPKIASKLTPHQWAGE